LPEPDQPARADARPQGHARAQARPAADCGRGHARRRQHGRRLRQGSPGRARTPAFVRFRRIAPPLKPSKKHSEKYAMQLSADEISSIIKKQIQNFDRAALVSETGTVLTSGDGIARVYGLEGALAGELVEFPGQIFGLVLNLEQDSVGVAVLGDAT